MVHMAACLFYVVGRQFHRLWPYTEHRSWIVAGGAAGIAAAFNAPLAGVVFVLEELAQQHFHQFKTVVISAAIIGEWFPNSCRGNTFISAMQRSGMCHSAPFHGHCLLESSAACLPIHSI